MYLYFLFTKFRNECQSIIDEKRKKLIELNQELNSIDNLDMIDIDKLQSRLKEYTSDETGILLKFRQLKEEINIDNDKLGSLNLDSITIQIQKTDSIFSDTIKKYNIIHDKQFPDISRFSPVAMAIGIRPGQLCEIIRPSKTAINTIFYRICSS